MLRVLHRRLTETGRGRRRAGRAGFPQSSPDDDGLTEEPPYLFAGNLSSKVIGCTPGAGERHGSMVNRTRRIVWGAAIVGPCQKNIGVRRPSPSAICGMGFSGRCLCKCTFDPGLFASFRSAELDIATVRAGRCFRIPRQRRAAFASGSLRISDRPGFVAVSTHDKAISLRGVKTSDGFLGYS